MKLLLTSNGFLNTPLEKDFSEMTGGRANLKVAVVPTAGDPIDWVPEKEGDAVKDYVYKLNVEKQAEHAAWLETYVDEWAKRGHEVVVADLKDDPAELRKKIESADVIDVLGGDANYLLDWAKKSKFDTYLGDALRNGAIYVGTSAGSSLVTPDIGLTWWEQDWKLDHVGLGLVDFVLVPHQSAADEQKNVEQLSSRREHLRTAIDFPWRVYLLQDGQAIKVTGDVVEHVGPGTKNTLR